MNWQVRDGAVWVQASLVSELAAGSPVKLLLSPSMPGWKQRHDVEVFVVGGEPNPLVLSSECSHQGCPVDWKVERFSCPCHGSAFDAEGAVLNGPATKPLSRLQSSTEGDALWIRVRDQA